MDQISRTSGTLPVQKVTKASSVGIQRLKVMFACQCAQNADKPSVDFMSGPQVIK